MSFNVRPIHPLFGAELQGIDLKAGVSDETILRIEAAIGHYAVVLFRGQDLTGDEQLAFAKRFGEIDPPADDARREYNSRLTRGLVDVSNVTTDGTWTKDDRRRLSYMANQLWHTDSSFKKVVASYSMLFAAAIPPEGGDTEFADMRAAYDSLDPAMKERIKDLVAEHSLMHSRRMLGFEDWSADELEQFPAMPQPLIRRHPQSNRVSLYLSSHAARIVDMPLPEGRSLLNYLTEIATQRQFVYTHRWRVGDMVIWDNRCTMHRVRPYDDLKHNRQLRRATVADIPIAA